jgi:hypothetical protein
MDLNVIEWGDGVFGAEAAARYHYGGGVVGGAGGALGGDGARPAPLWAGREFRLPAATHLDYCRAYTHNAGAPCNQASAKPFNSLIVCVTP